MNDESYGKQRIFPDEKHILNYTGCSVIK